MKTRLILLTGFALLFSLNSGADSSYFEDDLYFNPRTDKVAGKEKVKVNETERDNYDNKGSVRIYDRTGRLKVNDLRDVDEYNRHYSYNIEDPVVADTLNDSLFFEDETEHKAYLTEYLFREIRRILQ